MRKPRSGGCISTEANDNSAFVSRNDKQRRDPALGVNLLSHFCFSSGLGRAALTTKTGARMGWCTGCRVVTCPLASIVRSNRVGSGLGSKPIQSRSSTSRCSLTLKRVIAAAGSPEHANVYRIAYLYWELEGTPHEWSRHVTQLINELWVPTPFVAQAMRTNVPSRLRNAAWGFAGENRADRARDHWAFPPDHFVFLFVFDMCSDFERKNPLALIRAFRLAFSRDEPVTLVIKLCRGQVDPINLEQLRAVAQQNSVLVIDRLVSNEEANGFIEMCDCFVSLHRAEGFGLGLAEAMLKGKPVIGTNYSGNLAFMNRENSLLVDCELVEIAENGSVYKKGFHWAEPSEAHAAELMRSVFENPHEAIARAERAKKGIAEQFSVEKAGQRMKRRLEEIRNCDTARAR